MLWLLCAISLGRPAQAQCDGAALRLITLARDSWLVQAADGEANAANRGLVSHLLAHREGGEGGRLWLLGSGPSPRIGQAVACQLAQQAGQAVTDVISPWPRPEAVLGNAAFASARLWAHEAVAKAMAEQCAHCTERLRARLGAAAADLGPAPVVLPTELLQGERGHLGPWAWWRLWRMPQVPVTVFHLRGSVWWFAPGLLWRDGAPDLRDSNLLAMTAATQALLELAAAHAEPGAQWWGEQGGVMRLTDVQAHLAYWQALSRALQAAQDEGAPEWQVPEQLPGVPQWMTRSERHRLNWQRGWREIENR